MCKRQEIDGGREGLGGLQRRARAGVSKGQGYGEGAVWVGWERRGPGCGRRLHVLLFAVLTWLGWKWRRRSSIQRSLSEAERQEKQRLPPAHVTCRGEGAKVRLRPRAESEGRGQVDSCLQLPGSSAAPPGGWGAVARCARPAQRRGPARKVWPAIPESPEHWEA